jgi:homoserine dehydrogenase
VTSNKELVARFGAKLLKTAREHGCNYFFEASVGGAIPIIRPLHECLAADKVLRIEGILNGTTNFILTRILDDGMAFDEALALAQSLGYAEKDPAADISGADACRKICILAALSFGRHVYPEWVFTEGIEKIGPVDAAYAAKYGAKIKLIASARVLTPDESDTEAGKLFITVEPQFVCEGNQISHVSDVFNAVSVFAEAAGELMFFGRGAGKLPTASAVLGDVISAATSKDTVLTQSWTDSEKPDFIADKSLVKRSFYLRTTDGKTAVEAFSEAEIFEDREDTGETALIVSGLTEKAIRERIKNIEIMIPIKE